MSIINDKELDKILKRVERPGRYVGGEINMEKKDINDIECHFCFAFPDKYEIGMSYLGLQILYDSLNKEKNVYCERTFAPDFDMEAELYKKDIPLFSLETKSDVKDFDILGFTLQYEMAYTNIINMLKLSGIPLLRTEREQNMADDNETSEFYNSLPIVIAGGPCSFNPEPLADFIDLFVIGEAEELIVELSKLYIKIKNQYTNSKNSTCIIKDKFLTAAAKLDGVYVPKFFDISYKPNGTISSIVNHSKIKEVKEETIENILELSKKTNGELKRVKKVYIENFDSINVPKKPLIPILEVVQDRAIIETFRGCLRGCRFCQAGFITRPVREKTAEHITKAAKDTLSATGHEELSLLSLSTSDHSSFEPMVTELMKDCAGRDVSLSLPSMRMDSFSFDVLTEIQKYKRTGLTFAPEAGTQRLRDVINKNISEEEILFAVRKAVELGWQQIKLYFMIGLPTETDADLDGIADLVNKIIAIKNEILGPKSGRFSITVSVANFVPKANTPFQWEPQNSAEEFIRKHDYLREKLSIKGVRFSYHDSFVSALEGVLARGDRRVGRLLLIAHQLGCKFDGWTEHFHREVWAEAMSNWQESYPASEQANINADFYTTRQREFEEILPWDFIDTGVTKEFLISENIKAKKEETTPDCRTSCSNCGLKCHS
ncbi:MAG: TIGR03960 family B12-binding radical SAM protein [Anaerovoracaceae bacterium]